MSNAPGTEADSEIQAQLILLAASKHDVEALRALLRRGSANVQDPDTGFTPLHAAIAACENDHSSSVNVLSGGAGNQAPAVRHLPDEVRVAQQNGEASDFKAAAKTLRLLLQNGAIWNEVDKVNETPGCSALRLGLKELYDIMVNAGVRAEMLLNRLDEYEPLEDDGEDEDEEWVTESDKGAVKDRRDGDGVTDISIDSGKHVEDHADRPNGSLVNVPPCNEGYLQSSLHFQDGRILDDAGNGVMMAWETDIMKRSADLICPKSGLRILNVGHGMGIIDGFFQEKSPNIHHIIEAHPAVLERMKKDGWYDKPNVTVHEGRWQEMVPTIMEEGILFDAIYFDTFAEDYKALRDFFSDCLIGLLDDGAKWGFFNGLGADRQICYDVYTKVVEMELFEAGFDAEWELVPVPEMEREWRDMDRKYWTLQTYRLPVCSFIGDSVDESSRQSFTLPQNT